MNDKKNWRKMKFMLLFLFTAMILMLVACGGSSGGGQSAGVKDGAIELADARFDFGANQIGDSSKSTLTVIKIKDTDHEAADGINSDLFELYLEEDLNQPVTVTIPMKDTTKPEGDNVTPALGIGLPVVSKTDSANTLYSFVAAEIVGDNLVATFVPSEHMAEISINGANGEARPSLERVRLGLFWMQTYFEDGGHFLVEFPAGNIKRDGWLLDSKTRPAFLNDLEEVYEAYNKMGFQYNKRKNWPMKITIQSMDDMGYYAGSYWSPAEGYIAINRNLFQGGYDAGTVKPLLAHEFFHFVQANYMGNGSDLLWLDEATATYFENEKSGQFPSIVSEYKTNVFQGVFPKDNTASHGYARMPLIKFLVNKVGQEGIKNVYTLADGGAKWEDALLSAFGPPANWAPAFYEAMVRGEVSDYATYSVHRNLSVGQDQEVGKSLALEIPSADKVKKMLDNDETPLLASTTLSIESFGAQLVAFTIDDKNLKNLADDMDPVVSVSDGHLTLLSAKSRDVKVMPGGLMENFKKASEDKIVYLAIVTGLHESGKKDYELKVEFPSAPTLDELVGSYPNAEVLFKEVYIDPEALAESSKATGEGCDIDILGAIKAMEGETMPVLLNVSKTGDDKGILHLSIDIDDDDDDALPMSFSYSNGTINIDFTKDDAIIKGTPSASYGKNKDVVINGDIKLSENTGPTYIILTLNASKPL